MGALPRPLPPKSDPRKPPAVETKRDLYGRDPNSPAEQFRRQTDYEQDTGYAPLYHAVLADLPRLASGAVCYAFVLVVNALSYGRGLDPKTKRRYDTTEPISAAELAEKCQANLRDIQRQITELAERKMVRVKTVGAGYNKKYALTLLYREWRGLEDYAVWKRRQVVPIDSAVEEESAEEELLPISKDAVRLTSKVQAVKPGRACRAIKVAVGVREFSLQNASKTVDLRFEAVIQSGRLVVSAQSGVSDVAEVPAVLQAIPSNEGTSRHPCREVPSNGGSETGKHPSEQASRIVNLFDSLLQKSGSRLLSPDKSALTACCAEQGAMPHDFLIHFVMTQRADRPISGPKVVVSIIRDARLNWERGGAQPKPPAEPKITDADIARMIEQERIERAKQVAALRKRRT